MQPLAPLFYFMKRSDKDNLPKILFETNHVLVAYKPANQAVPIEHHPTHSLEGSLQLFLSKRENKPKVFLRPLHRLDKPVEGLVLFAKSSKALSRLQKAQKEGTIQKYYVARVKGKLKQKSGKLVHNLVHGDHRALVTKEGKHSELRYRVWNEEENTLVSIYLLTGRYHQIRAQFAAIDHPICQDDRYMNRWPIQFKSIDLCHTHLSFLDPITNKRITVKYRACSFLKTS